MNKALIFSILLLTFSGVQSQTKLPLDPSTKKVVYSGTQDVDLKSKKKMMAFVQSWTSVKREFPPMVFSVIKAEKDSLVLKALTEVPSLKSLHPISFKLTFVTKKKKYEYRAEQFYIEDIKLSLEEWLEKFAKKSNERNKKNVKLISEGLDSHIYLTLKQLTSDINNAK